eukprot:1433-Eustigmatos_ZCMA.PRE.1
MVVLKGAVMCGVGGVWRNADANGARGRRSSDVFIAYSTEVEGSVGGCAWARRYTREACVTHTTRRQRTRRGSGIATRPDRMSATNAAHA